MDDIKKLSRSFAEISKKVPARKNPGTSRFAVTLAAVGLALAGGGGPIVNKGGKGFWRRKA